MRVQGSRPNRRMDMVQRRSHHSPRSWISVSYFTTEFTHIPGLLVVVSSVIVPWYAITAQRNARLVPHTHTLSSPSSLMVVLVGSSVPILYQNLACPPRYPLRKGKCCRCQVEPGVLLTFGVDGRTRSLCMVSYTIVGYTGKKVPFSLCMWILNHASVHAKDSNSTSSWHFAVYDWHPSKSNHDHTSPCFLLRKGWQD